MKFGLDFFLKIAKLAITLILKQREEKEDPSPPIGEGDID